MHWPIVSPLLRAGKDAKRRKRGIRERGKSIDKKKRPQFFERFCLKHY
jgi:hypothetical protein